MCFRDFAPAQLLALAQLAKRFRTSRRGNIAVLTALLMTPIIGAMGLAIDYGNALLLKSRLDQAALAAASAAANAARNVVQSAAGTTDSYDQRSLDIAALAEGSTIGQNIFSAQLGTIINGSSGSPVVTVKRVSNTFTAQVEYNASLNTYFARLFNVNSFNLTGQRSIIIGMLDVIPQSSTPAAVIDEKWETTSNVQTTDTSIPVINDWLSGTPGRGVSPRSPAGGPVINGRPSASMQVGDPTGLIPPILSKKVYLPAGTYELRYWYKSTVIYPDYEPVHICGSVESEMNWVTASTTRTLTSRSGSWRNVNGVGNAQSARAGVYLTPVLGNPQLDTQAPVASSFPLPPKLPYDATSSPPNLRADNSINRIDICAYSSRWIQRSISTKITVPGYFWLSFIAEPPTSTSTMNGFYLGPLKLCQDACDDTLNVNWPWAPGTKLYDDSFENPSRTNGDAFDLASSSGFTMDAKYERPPGWGAGRYGGNAAGAWDLPGSIVYSKPTAYDGATSIETKRLGIWLYRRMLLMPGVYKISFMANMKRSLPSQQWCLVRTTDINGVATTSWRLTDVAPGSLPGALACDCPAGGITTIVMSDEASSGGANASINNTAPAHYRNTINPSGSAMADCHAFDHQNEDQYCVLVARTQYYGFQLRVQGPYNTDDTGQRGLPRDLGTGGVFLDKLQVTLLTPGVKNKFTATPLDPGPGDFENYTSTCKSNLGTRSTTATAENIISGGVPVWPGLAVPDSAYTTKPNRLVVTAPLQ